MKKLLASLLTLFSLTVFAETPMEAFEMASKGLAVLIDVREEAEIKDGMIVNALWFQMSKTKDDKEWVTKFRKMIQNKKVFLYCRSGNRSGQMKVILEKQGIAAENIGGIMTLKEKLPLKKP
jgi:rhodanese-related sulfurtransferase